MPSVRETKHLNPKEMEVVTIQKVWTKNDQFGQLNFLYMVAKSWRSNSLG